MLDIRMPASTVMRLPAKMRERESPVRLIAITGRGQENDKEMAFSGGFDYHLTNLSSFSACPSSSKARPTWQIPLGSRADWVAALRFLRPLYNQLQRGAEWRPEVAGRGGMIIALSRFTIANDMSADVRDAFRGGPHLVDRAPGFLGMEVMSPTHARAEIWLLTRWRDEPSYRSWHRGHEYHESHSGIPKGLKLVRGHTSVQLFEVFAD